VLVAEQRDGGPVLCGGASSEAHREAVLSDGRRGEARGRVERVLRARGQAVASGAVRGTGGASVAVASGLGVCCGVGLAEQRRLRARCREQGSGGVRTWRRGGVAEEREEGERGGKRKRKEKGK